VPMIRKVLPSEEDPHTVGQWVHCTTARATELLSNGSWVDADRGVLFDASDVVGESVDKVVSPVVLCERKMNYWSWYRCPS